MRRPFLAWAAVLAVLWLGGVRTAGAAPAASPDDQKKARELVKQLGDPKFQTREAAAKELVRMGRAAKAALLEGAKSPDAEVAERSRRLLPLALEADLKARMEAFLANPDGPLPDDLPGIRRFVKIAGAGKDSRELYAELLKTHGKLLDALEQEPKKAGEHYQALCYDFYNRIRPRKKGVGTGPVELSRADVAAFLFAGSDPNAERRVAANSLAPVRLLMVPELRDNLSAPSGSEPLRKLFAAWLERETNTAVQRRGLLLATDAEVKECLPALLKFIGDKKSLPSVRAQALMALAKFGDRKHAEVLKPLLEDDTVIGTARFGNGQQGVAQVRDVALGVTIQLHGKSPSDFGFEGWREGLGLRVSAYFFYGFADDDKRAAAFKKWKEWVAAQEKK